MKRVFFIILTSIVVVITLTLGKYSLFEHAMPNANYGLRAIITQKKINNLFIGSSMFRKGIYCPDYGDSSWLLAYNGNQPALEAIQLEQMISEGLEIKQLIVDLYPYSVVRPASLSDTRQLMDGDLKYTYRIYRNLHDIEQYGPEGFYKMIIQSNNEMAYTWLISYPMINARYHQGANESKVKGCSQNELNKIEAEEMQVISTSLHEDQIKGLTEIIRLCKENGIKLFFLETPKYAKVYEDEVFCSIMKEYLTFLSSQNQRVIISDTTQKYCQTGIVNSDNVFTYNFNHFDASCFSDLIHLSTKGRLIISDKINPLLQ